VVVVVLGGVLVVSNVRGHSEIRASQVTLTATAHRLEGVRAELAHAHRDLAAAERRGAAAGRSFDLAQAALSSTQATLAQDDASIYYQGIDLGQLNGCLSLVEQALNQLAVGQTAGGLASLRASSPSCSVLEAGHTP
jgi:DNA-binding PucR family transcriptional regulator